MFLFECVPPEYQSIWKLFKLFIILNATYNEGQNVSVNCDVLTPLIYLMIRKLISHLV
jgi:hypothetical protein